MMSNHKLMRHVRSLTYLLSEDYGYNGVVYQNNIVKGMKYGKSDVKIAAFCVDDLRIQDR